MRSIPETKDKIVALADEFIREKGYNAFSYKDIADTLALRNAAIHYSFPTKEALGVQVVNRELDLFTLHQASWLSLAPQERLKKLFDRFEAYNCQRLICLMGSLSPDFETLPVLLQGKVRELSNRLLDWLSAVLQEGRSLGQLHFAGDAYDRSLIIMSDLMASLLLARVLGQDTFQRISTQSLKDILFS